MLKILLLIILIAEGYLCFRILKDKSVSFILAISLTAVVILWYLVPGFIVLVYPFEKIANPLFFIEQNDFVISYFLESMGLIAALTIFMAIVARRNNSKLVNIRSNKIINRNIIYLIIIAYIGTIIYRISAMGFNYLDNNAASLYDEIHQNTIIILLSQLLFSAMVLFFTLLRRGDWLIYFIYVIVVADSILRIISGSRIWFIAPIIIFAFRYLHRTGLTKRAFMLSTITLVLIIYIVLPLSYAIQETRYKENSGVLSIINDFSFHATSSTYIKMIFNKFDSFSAGFALIKNAGGFGSAGLMPFYGSALVFIPRTIWPERPVAGSADGTIYGHPSRLVPSSIMPFSDSLNMGVAPLHISLWQLGILGAGLFVVGVAAFLFIINNLLLSQRLVRRTAGIYLLSIPSFHQIITSLDVIIRQLVIVLFFLVLIELLQAVLTNR